MNSVKEERLQEILDAACRVFASSGFEKAKIEDIAKSAGIGKSTIYEYFDSKMDVFIRLFESVFDLYRKQLTAILKNDEPLREKLIRYLRLHSDAISKRYPVVFMHLHETFFYKEIRDFASSQYAFIHQLLLSCFEDAANKGEIRADIDLNCVCYLIYGTVQSISFDYVFGQMRPMTDQVLCRLVDSIMNVLSPQKA